MLARLKRAFEPDPGVLQRGIQFEGIDLFQEVARCAASMLAVWQLEHHLLL